MPTPENPQTNETKYSAEILQQAQHLCQNFSTNACRVVSGEEWGIHYPQGPEIRKASLKALYEGEQTKESVLPIIQPDGVIFPMEEISSQGFQAVESRLRDITGRVSANDTGNFLDYLSGAKEKGISAKEAFAFHESVIRTQTQRKLFDSYGYTGKEQMRAAFREESKRLSVQLAQEPSSPAKAMKALKSEWLDSVSGVSSSFTLDGQTKLLVDQLQPSFEKYIRQGDQGSFEALEESLVNRTQNKIQKEEKDLSIPPEEKDTYEVPPLQQSPESKEKEPEIILFEITPSGSSRAVKIGKYIQARKSYFNPQTIEWSTQKQITEYKEKIEGTERQTIRGRLEKTMFALPRPENHAFDIKSLSYTGNKKPLLFRDQNGCFYIQGFGSGEFSIDYLQENPPFEGSVPISEDTKKLFQTGTLSSQTESFLSSLSCSSTQKAIKIQHYIKNNHFYPGDGNDLKKAEALQAQLKHNSNADNYIQNLDASELLECYSAQNLFIALCRSAGVPARLGTGHELDSAQNGKAEITNKTAHAWSEIWDGQQWQTIDATPSPRAPDKKNESDNTSTERANDELNSSDDSDCTYSDLDETSDLDFSEAQEKQQQLKDTLIENQHRKQHLQKEISAAESAKELKELQNRLNAEDLLEDLNGELQKILEAKENSLKEKLKDQIDQMHDEGFLNEETLEKMQKELAEGVDLDQFETQLQYENKFYKEYEHIRENVLPLVEEWYEHFSQHLPRKENFSYDEDAMSRRGRLDTRSVNKFRNLTFQTVYNPRVIESDIEPKFIASIVVDISGSMGGQRIYDARKMLVFYSELFEKISQTFGYIKFSIHVFDDEVTLIKDFDQSYDSTERYSYDGREQSTVKYRLMDKVKTRGGTDILRAVKKSAESLNTEKEEHPDYLSALYFIGDGGDNMNKTAIKTFLETSEEEGGFGEHMKSAVLIGKESDKAVLSELFGEENTDVASNFEDLVESNMVRFEEDVTDYIDRLTT